MFQIKAPNRDFKLTSSSAAAPLAGGVLRRPPAALAPSLSHPRRQAGLPPASSRSRKSASEIDLAEIYADAQQFNRAEARGRPHGSSTSPDGEAWPHPRWSSTSLSPSALLLGLPPVCLLSFAPYYGRVAPPRHRGRHLPSRPRGSARIHSSSIHRCRGPICRCRGSSHGGPGHQFIAACRTSLRLAATSSESKVNIGFTWT
jgi:hypothetical protein